MWIKLKCYCPEIAPYGGCSTIKLPEGSTVFKVLTENLKIDWQGLRSDEIAQYIVLVNKVVKNTNTILHNGDQLTVIKVLLSGG